MLWLILFLYDNNVYCSSKYILLLIYCKIVGPSYKCKMSLNYLVIFVFII